MTLNDMTTGVLGVSFRAGSCRIPQSTAMNHPRRQSVSATVIDSNRNPANKMVIIMGRDQDNAQRDAEASAPLETAVAPGACHAIRR